MLSKCWSQRKENLQLLKHTRIPPCVHLTPLTGFPTDWKGGQEFLDKPNLMAQTADLHYQSVSEDRLNKFSKIH